MKDFLNYLKARSTWVSVLVSSAIYFLLVQAYVYPTMTFDFSVIYKWSTWGQNAFFQLWMTIVFYFVLWRPTQKNLKKEKPQNSEVL